MTLSKQSILLLLPLFITLTSKDNSTARIGNEWEPYNLVVKEENNIRFSFPASGYAFEHKDEYVRQIYDAIEANSSILNIPAYDQPFKVFFHSSRDEMKVFTGFAASGTANAWARELHMTAYSEEESDTADSVTRPPIVHELMHLISMTTWGYPDPSLHWTNEGLATYAAQSCNGYSIGEIYRYMLENGHLYMSEDFNRPFYELDEMIAYHQSAFYVECILEDFGGAEALKMFWQSSHGSFEEVFGISFNEFVESANQRAREKYDVPLMDWEVFKKGCVQ